MENKKYKPNIKNGGNPPTLEDQRMRFVPIECKKCMECMKKKAREWKVRLTEDIKTNTNGKFITLTFSNESIKELNERVTEDEKELIEKSTGYERDNRIATKGVRLWLERWRKQYGVSVRHWLITELGGNGTENIHMHGIIWTDEKLTTVEKIWNYGFVWKGKLKNGRLENYVSERTINYMTKYVNKVDILHKGYQPKLLNSKGIGSNYINTVNAKRNEYNEENTKEEYITRQGYKTAMPIYWRNKIWNEKQREKLWIKKLDQQIRWVGGEKIDISQGEDEYYKLLKYYQGLNRELGYGNNEDVWKQTEYENERRNMLREKRIMNTKQKSV